MDSIDLGLRILDQSGRLIEDKILESTLPHIMFIDPLLGTLKWIEDNKVELLSKDKCDRYELTSSTPQN